MPVTTPPALTVRRALVVDASVVVPFAVTPTVNVCNAAHKFAVEVETVEQEAHPIAPVEVLNVIGDVPENLPYSVEVVKLMAPVEVLNVMRSAPENWE